MSQPLIIAVDGPAASGKGTVGVALAKHFGLPYLDTGLLYRAVAIRALDARLSLSDADAVARVAGGLDAAALDDPVYRTRAAGEAASQVAVHAAVRQSLLDLQRRFAADPRGALLDGRDIGTVIAPHATAKLFITATPEVRATRRWKQLVGQGEDVAYDAVLADIRIRDERDSGRATAPLVRATDAHLLDTSEMSIEAAFREALALVEASRSP